MSLRAPPLRALSALRSLVISILAPCGLVIACSTENANDSVGAAIENVPIVRCAAHLEGGLRPIANARELRFQGKVTESTARCRGGDLAATGRSTPWVDWQNYYSAGDEATQSPFSTRNWRGINGALMDLEYQRVELIKFNLFDNSGTFEEYVNGRPLENREGPALQTWAAMRLPESHPNYADVGGAATQQQCRNALIRARTLTGICNDIFNPLMGSSGTLFARNVEFESTFPDRSADALARNRHGHRLSLLVPDPQVISRRLFTRPAAQSGDTAGCNNGFGAPGYPADSRCEYTKAPFFNVLAAFWIQFMTHDWFSHLEEGHNAAEYMAVGCATAKNANGDDAPLPAAEAARLGCRPGDRIDKSFVAQQDPAPTFHTAKGDRLARAPMTFRNTNTAWWDASQLYGYDERSQMRVKRDPKDPARLQMVRQAGRSAEGDAQGYLPTLAATDPMNPEWAGQEATAFPDNWTIGLSFYHNVFAREHNQFVDAFRQRTRERPNDDSGLRDPAHPQKVIRYRDVTNDELFDVARLVVAAEIAKIHTIEWTPQLLYDEPLYRGMNGNWNGLVGKSNGLGRALASLERELKRQGDASKSNSAYSVAAAGPGIVGLGSQRIVNGVDQWSLANPVDVNGGTNHFGSPFNFPEEFITVYRLHPLVPDLIEYRDVQRPNEIANMIPVVETFRGRATAFMHDRGLSNWALSMGRQRLGALTLQNHPRFLQNLHMGRLASPTQQIDVAALDLIRDRERGVPRFNEFRRQYGLRSLTGFDDFIDRRPGTDTATQRQQRQLAATMREIYGTHRCDSTKVITDAQLDDTGRPITDCLGHKNGDVVDNVEDLDTVVGWLAESTRPHGFAISETQFVVFILNASRRLFSDRFFTSSYRPEFYSRMGIDWVNNNGPDVRIEAGEPNGHAKQPVSPLKRVLLRTMPELKPELDRVVNAFDPWARDRGAFYSLAWKPRPGAESDPAFKPTTAKRQIAMP